VAEAAECPIPREWRRDSPGDLSGAVETSQADGHAGAGHGTGSLLVSSFG
jgi:hypothetical protein